MSDLFESFSSGESPFVEKNTDINNQHEQATKVNPSEQPLPTLNEQLAKDAVNGGEETSEIPDLTLYKKQLVKLGIFALILMVCMGLSIGFIKISRNSWKEGLQSQVEKALFEAQSPYSVNIEEKLYNPVNTNIISFSLIKNKRLAAGIHAVIVRVTTLYGPFPALYIYDEASGEVIFEKFLTLSGKAEKSIENSAKNSQISYWSKRIPLFFQFNMENQDEK